MAGPTTTRSFLPRGRDYAGFGVSNLLSAATEVGLAFVFKWVADAVTAPQRPSFAVIAFESVGFVLLYGVCDFWASAARSNLGKRLTNRYRHRLFTTISARTPGEFSVASAADYQNKLVSDADVIESDYYGGILLMIYQAFTLVLSLAAIAWIDVRFILVVIVLSVLPLIIPVVSGRIMQRAQRDVSASRAEYLGALESFLSGHTLAVMYDAVAEFQRRHAAFADHLGMATQRLGMRKYLVWSSSLTLVILMVVGTWVAGLGLSGSGLVTVAQIVALAQLITGVVGLLQTVGERYSDIVAAKALIVPPDPARTPAGRRGASTSSGRWRGVEPSEFSTSPTGAWTRATSAPSTS